MQFKRHIISDYGLLEQVDKKISSLKQRWVRKVEWQIRDIMPMLQKAQTNDVVESPAFSAAGVPELKFVFYPKGIDPANSHYCGLYLRCSEENLFLKYTLTIGEF